MVRSSPFSASLARTGQHVGGNDWIGDNEQPDDITLVLARAG
jgi:hypothetical protein